MRYRRKLNLPELLGLLVRGRRGELTVRVWCPFCARWHCHGWPPGSKRRAATHRAAHCFSDDSPFKRTGYFIRIASRKDLAAMAQLAGESDALARARESEVTR